VSFLRGERQDFPGHSCPACTACLPAAPVYYRAGEAGAASRSVNLLIFMIAKTFACYFI
jgi:hypothetical protein